MFTHVKVWNALLAIKGARLLAMVLPLLQLLPANVHGQCTDCGNVQYYIFAVGQGSVTVDGKTFSLATPTGGLDYSEFTTKVDLSADSDGNVPYTLTYPYATLLSENRTLNLSLTPCVSCGSPFSDGILWVYGWAEVPCAECPGGFNYIEGYWVQDNPVSGVFKLVDDSDAVNDPGEIQPPESRPPGPPPPANEPPDVPDSISQQSSLGRDAEGKPLGRLTWKLSTSAAAIAPSDLMLERAEAGDEVEDVTSSGGHRQILSASVLVDIVPVLDSSSASIGFLLINYANDGTLGFPSGGTPIVTTGLHKISQVKLQKTSMVIASSTIPGLRVESQTTGSEEQRYTLYSDPGPVSGTGEWIEEHGATAIRTTRTPAVDGIRSELVEDLRRDPATSEYYVTSSRVLEYQAFPWAEEVISTTTGSGLGARTSTQTYVEEAGRLQGKLHIAIHEDGSWVRYFYNEDGTVKATYRPWLDGPAGTLSPEQVAAIPASECLVEEYQETNYPVVTKVHTTKVKGTVVSRAVTTERWVLDPVSSLNVKEVQTETFAADGGKMTDQRSATDNSSGESGKLIYSISPDGRRTSYEREEVLESGAYVRTTTVTHGTATHPHGEPFRSLKEISVSGPDGAESHQTRVNTGGGSSALLSTRAVTRTTTSGGVVTEEKLDGVVVRTSTLTTGGVHISVDENGVEYQSATNPDTDTATQTRDGLAISLYRVGTLHNGSDLETVSSYEPRAAVGGVTPPGYVIRVTREANGVSMTESVTEYDEHGQLIRSTDSQGRTTTFAYASLAEGGTRTTETQPGAGTVITDTYRDGRTKQVAGTAVVPLYHFHGVEGGRLVHTVNYGAASSPRWEKTYTEGMSRMVRREQPDFGGAGVRATLHHYNTRGQLVRVDRPGLAPLLYEYDSLGEAFREGVDLNANGVLDLDSEEPVTERLSYFESVGSSWWEVQRTRQYMSSLSQGGQVQEESSRKQLGAGPAASVEMVGSGGVKSVTSVVIDRPNRKRTMTTTRPGFADAQETIINGFRILSKRPEDPVDTVFWYDSFERITAMSGPQGDAAYEYDEFGRLETETRRGSTTATMVTSYEYLADNVVGAGQVASATASVNRMTPTVTSATFYAYDTLGRVTDQWGPGTYPVHFVYNGYGEQVEMWTSRTALQDDSKPWEDPANSALVSKTYWAYDAATGQLAGKKDHDLKGVTYAYHSSGLLQTRTWARTVGGLPLTTGYLYDGAARVTGINYSDATPDVSYAYHRQGALRQVTDAAGVHTFDSLSSSGRVLRERITSDGGSPSLLAGLYLHQTEDANNRPTGFRASLTPAILGAQALALPSLAYTYYGQQVASVTSGWRTVNYVRDYSSGRHLLSLTRSAYPGGASGFASASKTDPALGPMEIQHGTSTVYQKRTLNGQKIDQVDNYVGGYHPKKDSSWTYAFDSRGQVTAAQKRLVTSTSPVTQIVLGGWDAAFHYDDMGNRITSRFGGDGEESSPVGSEEVSYEINALNQYTEVENPRVFYVTGNAPGASPPSVEVNGAAVERNAPHYWSRQEVAGTGPVWAPAEVELASGATTLTLPKHLYVPPAVENPLFDDDGNLVQDGRWVYAWDAENRLVGMTTQAAAVLGGVPDLRLTFAYDSQSRRIRKLVEEQVSSTWVPRTDTRFVYDGWNLIAEVEYLGTASDAPSWTSGSPRPFVRRTYMWGPDMSGTLQGAGGVGGLLAMTRHEHGAVPAKDYWATWDLNGNVIGLMDQTGLRALYEYDPFGNALRVNEPEEGLCPVRFSTKYADSETGLVYYGYRYYDSGTGRWINRDPIGEVGGSNLQGFVKNNGINRFDVLGLYAGAPQTSLTYAPLVAPPLAPTLAEISAASIWRLAVQRAWSYIGITSAFALTGAALSDANAREIEQALKNRLVECPCYSRSFYGETDHLDRPTWAIGSYSKSSPPALDERARVRPAGWDSAKPLYPDPSDLDATHMFANRFGGLNIYENLVTAFARDNKSKMRRVENRINELAKRHNSVCVQVVPQYRQYAEGEGVAPKYLLIDVVTSSDRGGREVWHTIVQFQDIMGYRETFFGLGNGEIFPLN